MALIDVQHDHCLSCYSKFCDFDIEENVSCSMMFCQNDCGQKFHKCKQEDHNVICCNQLIECINKEYGCPGKFPRRLLAKHLEVCPASILICTMEWNRWQMGASLLPEECKKDRIKQFQTLSIVDKDLDVACAIHDQRILLETVLPNSVVQCYSNLADGIYDAKISETSVQKSFDGGDTCMPEDAANSLPDGFNFCSEIKKIKEKCEMKKMSQEQASVDNTNVLLNGTMPIASETVGGAECFVNANRGVLAGELTDSPQNVAEEHLPIIDGLYSNLRTSKPNEKDIALSLPKEDRNNGITDKHFHAIDAYINEFTTAAPSFMALLNALDSDVSVVIDVVDMLIEKVESEIDGSCQPFPDTGEDDARLLRQSYDELLQQIFGTCGSTTGATKLDDQHTEKKLKKGRRRKQINWSCTSSITSGGYVSPSWGWTPVKSLKYGSTDTSDFPIDMSNPEWLSPEASIAKHDLIFRMFSILGSSKGYSIHNEKLTSHYIAESSCQTVAPFLIHLDLNASGHALCNASLSSATRNPQEKRSILSLLSGGEVGVKSADYGPAKMSDNLAYNNLALGCVIESVPRYQTKPTSMYSFMCGCILRRDQFASHVQNVHCEIMSGLNGWIEQKCPYALYGCNYSEPRFCPDHRSNAVIYNQAESSFTTSPAHWQKDEQEKEMETTQASFLDLPYEVHENIIHFLDSFSIRQLSLACTYLREVCRNHVTNRGVVEIQWVKRKYAVGAPSWKVEEKIWFFPTAFARINHWVLADTPAMVQHVSECPVVAAQDVKYKAERIKVIF